MIGWGLIWLTMSSCSVHDPGTHAADVILRFENTPEMADVLAEIAPLFGYAGNEKNEGRTGAGVLTLRDEKFHEQYLSLARSADDFLEYRLRYEVNVMLTLADGTVTWRDTIHTEETYSQDSGELISHISGLEELREQLVRRAAERVLRRTSVALDQP